jgi:hypothetical protein
MIIVFLQRTLKEKLPIFLINTLLLCIPLLALTHGQNDRQRYKYTCCAWAGGTFFQLWFCVSFFLLWREIVLGVTYLPYQLCSCVWLHRSVFWLGREKVLGVTYLPTIPVVWLCQFFGFGSHYRFSKISRPFCTSRNL